MTKEPLTIYYNPNCSKSRKALQILEQYKTQPQIIEYLETPPSQSDIKQILKKLGVAPIDLLRTTEEAFVEGRYQAELMSDEDIIEAIAQHPSLLQRPIVTYGNKAIIARPPINVLDIISS
jgi:arsenate reductase